MYCGIYKITNQINGKVYIGQSTNICCRWRAEKASAFNSISVEYDCPRSRAFRKYGVENFKFEIIEECQPSQLNEREEYWANYFNSYIPNGYNDMLCGNQHAHINKLSSFNDIDNIIKDLKETTLTGIEIGKKYNISDQTVSDINNGKCWRKDNISYPIRPRVAKEKRCPLCGKIISNKATHCAACSQKLQQVCERPDKETLLKEIATSSFVAVGKKYGVSDKAIVKWCIAYGLPSKKKDIVDLYKSIRM